MCILLANFELLCMILWCGGRCQGIFELVISKYRRTRGRARSSALRGYKPKPQNILSSAQSGDFLCSSWGGGDRVEHDRHLGGSHQMGFTGTVVDRTDALFEFVRREQTRGLDRPFLTDQPLVAL